MKAINAYLTFDGNAREAMSFYAKAFNAELSVQTFKESGSDFPGAEDRVMHARLTQPGSDKGTMSGAQAVLMASDSRPNDKTTFGDNIWLAVDCDDTSEQDRMFNAIAQGGNIVMPLDNTFWGARFGMIKDKYGIGWMFNCELKK
jgi:PhnB protein